MKTRQQLSQSVTLWSKYFCDDLKKTRFHTVPCQIAPNIFPSIHFISSSIPMVAAEFLDGLAAYKFIVSSSIYKPGPMRSYKTTLLHVRVKVSNFVSKIEVNFCANLQVSCLSLLLSFKVLFTGLSLNVWTQTLHVIDYSTVYYSYPGMVVS